MGMSELHTRLPCREIQNPDSSQRSQEGIAACKRGAEGAREYSQGQPTPGALSEHMELAKPSISSMEHFQSNIARPPSTTASVPPLEGAVVTGVSKKRDYSTSALLNDFRRQSESDTDAEPPISTRRLTESGQVIKTPRSIQYQPELEPSTRSAKRICTELKLKAQDLFDSDKALAGNCEWGLNKELTRTCDGGSDKTRISELAQLVKTLRRAVRSYQEKVALLHQFIAESERSSESSHTLGITTDTDDAARAADSARVQELEASLTQMTVALDEAKGRITQLQAENAAAEASAVSAAPTSSSLPQPPAIALRGDSVLSLEAQAKTAEPAVDAARAKENEAERLKLESTVAALNMQDRQLRIEVVTLATRLKESAIKYNSQVAAAEGEALQYKRELLEERSKSKALQVADKASKAAAERAEEELHSLRKQNAAQLNDAKDNKGELWKQMMQTKEQSEKKHKNLTEQLTDTQSALEAANSRCQNAVGHASMLEGEKINIKSKLEKAEQEIEECQWQILAGSKELVQWKEQEEAARKQAVATGIELAAALSAGAKASAEREQIAVHVAALTKQFEAAESARVAAEQRCARLQQDLELLTKDAEGLKEAIVVATSERDGLDANLADAMRELQESAGNRTQVEAERAMMRQELEDAQSKVAALLQAKTAAEDKALAFEGQMEALQDVVGAGDQKQMVGQLVTRVGNLEAALWEAEKSRRRNHNELMEVKGNIRVFCRLRPCSAGASVDPLHGDGVRCLVEGKAHDFFFDRVLPPTTAQETVFSSVSDVIQSALDGYHVCLFSYGQTGSGKTYTMNGNTASPGIIPRAVSMLLEASERLGSVGWTFRLEGTFIEVYNDVLRDLLAPVKAGTAGGAGARVLDSGAIKHDPKSHTQVLGATKILVDSEEQARDLLARAQKARSTDATAMNAESSRSHSVFTLSITGEHEEKGFKLLGSLNLVDLAGSERLARSQAEGQRQKETCAINKSLACLGDIFQALANKSGHIPYRNSKLTYLLQPCLGGDGKTLMFVNINPEVPSAYESLCALRFASKVNTVETGARGGAKRNVVSSGAVGSPADVGAAAGAPGGSGPGALPPLHRGNSESTLGSRSGLPRPSTGGAPSGSGRQSMSGGSRQSILPSNSRGSSAGKSSGSLASTAPSMSGRSSSVPVFKRQR